LKQPAGKGAHSVNTDFVTPSQRKQAFVQADEQRLAGAQQKRIKTAFGYVNVTVGGNEHCPAMVLWPSAMMLGSLLSYQYQHFASKYRVVLVDPPGVGKSGPLRKEITIEDSAEIVINILDALGIQKCIFGGNSWGAMLAAVFPAWYPERVIAAIVVNGTASKPDTAETIKMSIVSTLLYMNGTMPKWWVEFAKAGFSGNTATESNPEFMSYLDCVYDDDPKSIHFQLQGVILNRLDRHDLLRTIKNVPVLVIAGEEDRQFPVYVCRKMANAIADSTFVVLPEVAHLAARERPELVNPVIEKFLDQLSSLS
jgi:3-oxoadipate enol-lactonase